MAKNDLTFMDEVHKWTFSKKRDGHVLSPACLRVQQTYRIALRRANRFTLDDDAVRLCCHLSHEEDRLAGWSFLARLPYEVCWFEWNLHEKLREFDRMDTLALPFDPGEVSPTIGVLVYKEDPASDSPRWIAHQFYDFRKEGIFPSPVAYVFDPEGDPKWPVRGSKRWNEPTLSLIPDFPKVPITVHTGTVFDSAVDPESVAWGVFERQGTNDDGTLRVGMPEEFISRIGVFIDPWWSSYHLKKLADTGTRREVLHKTIAAQTAEERGALRYLVCILAAINGLPRDVKPVATKTGRFAAGMNMLPYLGHSTITINIPRDDRVVWARKVLSQALRNSQRRWHTVRGHWVVVERGKATGTCRHFPTMVESGLGMCERCELLIRWREYPEGRGDANLGVVTHEHVVKAKKRIHKQETV